MGKRKDISGSTGTEEESITESPGSSHKKHKKHKKKHKKKKDRDLDESFESTSETTPVKPAIRLKLKIGGETLGTKDITPAIDDNSSSSFLVEEPVINVTDTGTGGSVTTPWEGDKLDDTFHTKKSGEDTSDEEKQWLDALEAGELDDYGEIKKNANTKPLTTRQKALLHGPQDKELLQLPSGYKTVELTEEQLQRRQQRAKKRRQQAQEKREKDKKQTLDRLLKKQDSRAKKGRGSKRSNIPRVRYSLKRDGNTISIPQGFNLPFVPQPPKAPPKPAVKCGVTGCRNTKKYSCSKTGVPLCSLSCYKKNMAAVQAKSTTETNVA
ncbi:INO80 complex subunit B isoform X1 [Patella vulgata]|uniref:INO80 complex subunit B isoform X1 n=2 Tax=Patella vulgata TaxID=6465 RepID=UPI00217FE8A9|nr:INO80 complex subunit B isoform X1 [Patella vulgata]